MIILEFLDISKEITEDRKENIPSVDSGVLQETFFIAPVRFSVDNIELCKLKKKESPFIPIPLLSIAEVGYKKILNLKDKEYTAYNFPETGMSMTFSRNGNEITIHSGVNGNNATVEYEELLTAFTDFRSLVKEYLLKSVPEIKSHNWWGKWIEL